MSEYFYTKITISYTPTEQEKNLGIKAEGKESIVKIKLSLKGIKAIYPSYLDNGDDCVAINYEGDIFFVLDNFERIDKLHDEYLNNQKKDVLIKAQ